MSAGDTPDTKRPPGDERLEAFLVRAAPVLAVERGINIKSRVLLDALARELGLADDEFQAALRALNGHKAETPADPEALKRRAEYDAYARKQLKKLPRGVLTASLADRIAEAGTYQFQVPEADSRDVLKAATKELSIQVVTADEAARHVTAQIAALVRDADWVDEETQKRLHTVGIEWGLTHERVGELIQSHLQATRDQKTRRQWLLYAALGGGATLAAVCLGLLIWMNFGRPSESDPAVAGPGHGGPTTPGGEKPGTPATPASATAWWDRELTISMTRARVVLLAVIATIDRIKSTDPAVRIKAYDELVSRPWRGKTEEPKQMALGELLAGCLALDPDPKASDALRDKLLAVVPKDGEKPAVAGEPFRSFWAVDALLKAAGRETIAPERRAALIAALGSALGTTLDPAAEQIAVERRAFQKLYERLYRRMIVAAIDKPLEAKRQYDELMDYARSVLDQQVRLGLDAEFLSAVLPAIDEGWEQYVTVIRDVIQSKEPLHVLRMVEVYEKTDNDRLRDQLEYWLLRRVEVATSSDDPKEIARAVRAGLGASSKELAKGQRPAAFTKIAEGLIGLPRAAADNDAALLQEAANLARGNALGWALAQGELGGPVFDELLTREPAKVALAEGPAPPSLGPRPDPSRLLGPVSRLDPAEKHRLDQKILAIARYRTLPASERKIVLRYLAATADRVADIAPEQGLVVARYLLGGYKAPREDEEIIDIARPLLRWKAVKLGIADELADTKMTLDNVERLLHAALNREVRVTDDPQWREKWRLALLTSVRDELEMSGSMIVTPEETKLYDRGADALRDMYIAEARTAGVPSATYQAAATPSAALRILVEGAAARMAGVKLRSGDAELVAGMKHQLAAADYMAENDVRRTVLYQRLWLRLVSAAAAREKPELASDVDRIASELGEQDGKAKSAIEQLRDGELARLRVWALVHGKGMK